MSDSTVVSRECRFAFYVPSKDSDDDMHFVKEVEFYKDGTSKPNFRMIKNFQRSIWITKKAFQNHKSKKEWESLNKVVEFKSNQKSLLRNTAKAIGFPGYQGQMRDLCNSPYIYGTDIDSTALIKAAYQKKYPQEITPFKVAVFDVETDTIYGTKEIMMATISFKDKLRTVVQERFLQGKKNAVKEIKDLANVLLGDYIKARQIEIEVLIVKSEIDVVALTIQKAHEWKPDFLAVWNIAFDMSKIIEACKRADVRPEDILNDPSVPEDYRYFKFKMGMAKRVTSSGKVMVFKPSQQWHTVYSPASFYWIDAMCAYRQIRAGAPEEPSYALDFQLKKHLKITKLKFDVAKHLRGIEWHMYMQKNHPIEYICYNMFDCISMELLDEKIVDLCIALPKNARTSDFSRFQSQPRRKVDDLHHEFLARGSVIGTTGSKMTDEDDTRVVSVDDWIVMLQAERVADNGLQCIIENKKIRTNIRIGVSDLDVSGAYPTNGIVCNSSKKTTVKERIKIPGVSETTTRMNTINLLNGYTNSTEFCTDILQMPRLEILLNSYQRYLGQPPILETATNRMTNMV